jgi:hypothetical protein
MREILAIWAVLLGFALAYNSAKAQPIVTESTSKAETTVKSPPPSAISPNVTTINNDVCTVGFSGSVQTQVLGISAGGTVRDMNCERIKLSKNLFDQGMKSAAIAVLCQDSRVFDAMMNANTPCPIDGKIRDEAKELWEKNPERKPVAIEQENRRNDTLKGIGYGIGIMSIIAAILLL